LGEIDSSQASEREIAKTFRKCGYDPFDKDKKELENHLQSLSEHAIYNALIQNQIAQKLK
jgi:hypothetical protein